MDLSVTRVSGVLVAPSSPTPPDVLPLSEIDKLPVLRCNARTLHVFRHAPIGAAKLIREALSKALVPYYPLAGRLINVSEKNELHISCTGDGIWFVEASADCTLNDDSINYFDDDAALSIPYFDKLLPPPHSNQEDSTDHPLVQMQVTQFGCGGLVMGLVFCHSICDGLGAAQFLNAVAELARDSSNNTSEEALRKNLSVQPQWCRNFINTPTATDTTSTNVMPPVFPDYQLENVTLDISLEKIHQLKQEFQVLTGGRNCSAFEVAAATLWRQRTLAINLQANTEMKLVFFANCRHLLNPPLPKGFYGNCFFPVTVTVTSETLMEASSVTQVVKLIQEAKSGLPNEFAKWVSKDTNSSSPDPFAPPLEYSTLFISEWSRLGFNQVDYGWGTPVHVVPIQGSSIIPVGIVCSLPSPKEGLRLMTWCVNKDHLNPLIQNMNNIII